MNATQSIDALYAQHRDRVYRVALRYAYGNIAWAEDITQDVFVKLCEVHHQLEDLQALGAWFYRVTTNMCLNRLERDRFLQLTPVRYVLAQRKSPRTPEVLTGATQQMRRVLETLRTLPPKESVVFCMKHLDGKDQTEICETLKMSKGYVSKLLKRAEERVRKQERRANDG